MHQVVFPQDFIDNVMKRRGRLHVFDAIDPRKTALLVIDMQNAWVREGAPWEVPTAREVVPNINRLAQAMRRSGGLVVWIQATHARQGPDYWWMFFDHFVNAETRAAGSEALTVGNPYHDLFAGMDVQPGDPIIRKRRFSAFIQQSSTLEELLRGGGIDTVVIAGTRTNVCCESTARDAMMLDFKTIMVCDATAAATDREHLAGLLTVFQVFGDVRTTEEVVGLIEAGRSAGPLAPPPRTRDEAVIAEGGLPR